MKFNNLCPDIHENPFALSFKANLMTIHACSINEEVIGLQKVHSYAIKAEIFLSSQTH